MVEVASFLGVFAGKESVPQPRKFKQPGHNLVFQQYNDPSGLEKTMTWIP